MATVATATPTMVLLFRSIEYVIKRTIWTRSHNKNPNLRQILPWCIKPAAIIPAVGRFIRHKWGFYRFECETPMFSSKLTHTHADTHAEYFIECLGGLPAHIDRYCFVPHIIYGKRQIILHFLSLSAHSISPSNFSIRFESSSIWMWLRLGPSLHCRHWTFAVLNFRRSRGNGAEIH